MVADKIKELAAAKAKVTELEASIAAELRSELASLPGRYGFNDASSFLTAVKAASGKRRGRKPGAANAVAPKRRKRAKITDATRASVKTLVAEGKTGNEIAKSLGISLPSVQNIKTTLGLVRKKKK
ncbi:MAG: helix-turn-helix domain-containing protein [Opitutaceae bacterium]|nr:helix-turn-helix domain-containing protein [Opitutaceae bacterium]